MKTFQDNIIDYQGTEIAELKQRIAELEAQLAAVERGAWNAAIEAAANFNLHLIPLDEVSNSDFVRGWNQVIVKYADAIRGLKK